MAGFATAPTLVKVVLILALIGLVLHLIGFATAYWFSHSWAGYDRQYGHYEATKHHGLWKQCEEWEGRKASSDVCYSQRYMQGWFEATQAFETLGFIAALAALVLIILYIFVPATSGKRIVFILSMLACFVAAGCIILGIIIYGAKMKDNLSWSYALCTIAGIIFGISGILLVVDMLKR